MEPIRPFERTQRSSKKTNLTMNIYAINVCTDTKNTDRYDKVAVNEYPVIVLGTRTELDNHLKSNEMKAFIKKLFRTQSLYDAGVFRIRCIDSYDWYIDEFELPIKDFVEIYY